MAPLSANVVIIGAGVAGLAAAHRLQEMGFALDVYEARNRVGGRVLTVLIDGTVVELGAANIADGGEARHLRKLIDECGLSTSSHFIGRDLRYFHKGQLFSEQELIAQHDLKGYDLAAIAAGAKTMRDVMRQLMDEDDPLYQLLAIRLEAYEGGTLDQLSPYYTETLHHMLLGGLSTAHPDSRIQLMNVEGGNSQLAVKLAEGLNVHLNCPLRAISKNADGSYQLTFQSGETVRADCLLLTIPCSVYADIAFGPGVIPEERLCAIQKVPYGNHAKIISKIPHVEKNYINDHLIAFGERGKVLTLYYTGPTSRFSKDSIAALYAKDRKEMGSLNSTKEAQLAADQSFISYDSPVGYSWVNDPYARGTYSYIAAGQEAEMTSVVQVGNEPVKPLFAPVDGRLFFAGEHTSILFDVPGTMEAAAESGERAARMIENALMK